MSYKAGIVIERDGHGYAPKLRGCHGQGDNFEDVFANMKEPLELSLETQHEF